LFHDGSAIDSPREKIAPIEKIAVVGANLSPPNNRKAIFSQMLIVNKSPGGEYFTLGVHLCYGRFCH